jgi:hypothetical protein
MLNYQNKTQTNTECVITYQSLLCLTVFDTNGSWLARDKKKNKPCPAELLKV